MLKMMAIILLSMVLKILFWIYATKGFFSVQPSTVNFKIKRNAPASIVGYAVVLSSNSSDRQRHPKSI